MNTDLTDLITKLETSLHIARTGCEWEFYVASHWIPGADIADAIKRGLDIRVKPSVPLDFARPPYPAGDGELTNQTV